MDTWIGIPLRSLRPPGGPLELHCVWIHPIGVCGRFDLAALCGCHTLNVCLFVISKPLVTGSTDFETNHSYSDRRSFWQTIQVTLSTAHRRHTVRTHYLGPPRSRKWVANSLVRHGGEVPAAHLVATSRPASRSPPSSWAGPSFTLPLHL